MILRVYTFIILYIFLLYFCNNHSLIIFIIIRNSVKFTILFNKFIYLKTYAGGLDIIRRELSLYNYINWFS